MSDRDFVFALDLSNPAQFDSMLGELARAVCAHVGYSAETAGELAAALQGALHKAGAAGREKCAVRMEAQSGELQMVVTYRGGEWRTSRSLP